MCFKNADVDVRGARLICGDVTRRSRRTIALVYDSISIAVHSLSQVWMAGQKLVEIRPGSCIPLPGLGAGRHRLQPDSRL